MRLFFKHLFRSTKRKPTQPLILLLTVALSLGMIISVLAVRESVKEERYLIEESRVGSAEIKITLTGSSDKRFIFTEDVEKALGNRATAVGYYDLLLTSKSGDPIFSVAADLNEYSKILDVKFTAFSEIPENERAHAALISESFAENNSLSVGDSFTVELFGKEKSYTVYGISPYDYLGSAPLLIDISGVVRALTAESAFAAAVGEDFKPYSTVLVDLDDDLSVAEASEILKSIDEMNGLNVGDVSQKGYSKISIRMLEALIGFAVILTCLLTAVICYSCFSILAKERTEENYAFKAAGARPSTLILMQYAEAVCYWIAGSLLGIPVSALLMRFTDWSIGFVYADHKATFTIVSVALLLLLLSLLFTVTVFVLPTKKKVKKKKSTRCALPVVLSVCGLSALLCFTSPVEIKMALSILTTILLILSLFLCAPRILRLLITLIEKRREKRINEGNSGGSLPLCYAFKNIFNVRQLLTVSGMLALLTGAVLAITVTVKSIDGHTRVIGGMVNADYVVMNGTERCREKILELEAVESVSGLYVADTKYENSSDTNLISVSDIKALGEDMNVSCLPKGNEAVISYADAMSHSLKIGDTISLKHGDTDINLVVKDIVKSRYFFILFDSKNFGMDYTMLIPERKEGVSEEDFLSELTPVATEQIAAVANAEKLFEQRKTSYSVYVECGETLLLTVILFALIGIVNTFIECYRSRSEEFTLYRTAGMSKSAVRKMKLSEISVTAGYSLLFGLLAFVPIATILAQGIFSVGFDLIRNFVAWLECI